MQIFCPIEKIKIFNNQLVLIMKQYLFSYGLLQEEKIQMKLFGKRLHGSADELRGYKVITIEITDETFLSTGEDKFQRTLVYSKNDNDIVKGTALEMTEKELLLSDKFEPVVYRRTQVILKSGKQAWIYIADQLV